MRSAGGLARFGMDDGYAVGPRDVVREATRVFPQEVSEVCGLELEWSKTEVFSWDGLLPAGSPEGVTVAREEVVEGVFQLSFLCYGQPVGSPEYETSHLWKRHKRL